MIQSPQIAQPVPQRPVYSQAPAEYNAIKINIVDPKVNAPGSNPQAQVYGYPQASVYNYPQAQTPVAYPPVQVPQPQVTAPAQAPQAPVVPAPQLVNQQTINQVPPSVVEQKPSENVEATTTPATPAPQTTNFDVKATVDAIKGNDLQVVGDTIEKVADKWDEFKDTLYE